MNFNRAANDDQPTPAPAPQQPLAPEVELPPKTPQEIPPRRDVPAPAP